MSVDFDVVIVGAGPVGSTIAYYLCKDGLNVALIDKKNTNRISSTVCGNIKSTYP